MELLSPGTTLAALTDLSSRIPSFSNFSARDLVTPSFLTLMLCGQITSILTIWIASKTLVNEDGATFTNALKVWFFSLLAGLAIACGIIFAVPYVAASSDAWRVGLVVCGGGMLVITIALLIPMKIYVIGVLRAFLILLFAFILQVVVQFGLQMTVLKGAVSNNQIALAHAFTESMKEPPDPAATKLAADRATSSDIDSLLTAALHPVGKTPSLEEQEAQVQVLQQKLQARHDSLPPNDPHELALFQNQYNRYIYFLNAVKALRRVKSGTPVPGARADAGGSHAATH